MAFRNELDALEAQNESLRGELGEARRQVERADRVLEKAQAREAELERVRLALRQAEEDLQGPTGEAARARRQSVQRTIRLLLAALAGLAAFAALQAYGAGRAEAEGERTVAALREELSLEQQRLSTIQGALESERAAHRETQMQRLGACPEPRCDDRPQAVEALRRKIDRIEDPEMQQRLRALPGFEIALGESGALSLDDVLDELLEGPAVRPSQSPVLSPPLP